MKTKIKTMARLACALVVPLVMLAGCATVPEPRQGDALLVGRVEFRGSNYPPFGELDLNRTIQSGVMLTLRNLGTKNTATLTAGYKGYFNTASLEPGRYALVKIEVKLTGANGSWRNVYANTPNDLTFRVEPDAITNLGYLVWVNDGETNACQYYGNSKYDDVEAEYRERLAKTGWAAYEYREISVGSLNGW